MAKQLFINNFEQLLVGPVKDAPVTGTPATELDYGILRLSNGASGTLLDPGTDYYILTLLKRAGSSETNIEIVKVTDVDNSTPGECRITVNRAQEGTTAKAFIAGDYATLRFTKGSAENLIQAGDKDLSGGVPGLTLFKLNLRNAANTITSWFTTPATVARTWTMPDKDGTVAMTSDITGINSGTNTGDNAVNTLYSSLVTNATHTGDVTGATALTIAANAVTNAKAAQMAVNTIKGRITAGTGNAEDLTAANVRTILNVADGANNYVHTTNANLTGEVTSVGNAATVPNATVIGKVLTGYVSGAGTVAATDSILQAINKLNGNVALKGVGDVVSGGALGTPSSGTLTNCTADGTNAVGFRHIPQNDQTTTYGIVLTDAGKHIHKGGTGAFTVTIPANASVAFPVGTAITFINSGTSGAMTIAITTDTMRLAGAGTTGSRTLAAYGVATAVKVTSTLWQISGTNLT